MLIGTNLFIVEERMTYLHSFDAVMVNLAPPYIAKERL